MTEHPWSSLEKPLQSMVARVGDRLSWSWEDRFGAALAQFTADDKESILDLLKPSFIAVWDASNVKHAPARTAEICIQYGGLRPGQLLLSTDPEQDIQIFGAWWPWGNNQVISIRIIPNTINLTPEQDATFLALLKNWFGL